MTRHTHTHTPVNVSWPSPWVFVERKTQTWTENCLVPHKDHESHNLLLLVRRVDSAGLYADPLFHFKVLTHTQTETHTHYNNNKRDRARRLKIRRENNGWWIGRRHPRTMTSLTVSLIVSLRGEKRLQERTGEEGRGEERREERRRGGNGGGGNILPFRAKSIVKSSFIGTVTYTALSHTLALFKCMSHTVLHKMI